MPTTAQRNAARQIPATPENIKGALKNADKPVQTPAQPKAPSNKIFTDALKGTVGFYKQAFHVEGAVCLVYFATHGMKADKKTRAELRPIYAAAGFDCADKNGSEYITVQRRTDAFARLFDWLGQNEINPLEDWAEGAKPADAIGLIAERLRKDKLDTIRAVLVKAEDARLQRAPKARKQPEQAAEGTPAETTGEQPQGDFQAKGPAPEGQEPTGAEAAMLNAAAAQAEGQPQPQPAPRNRRYEDRLPVLQTAHVRLAVPPEATREELMELASMILDFAKNLQPAPAEVQ